MKVSKKAYWLFVGPTVFAFLMVVIIPLIMGIYFSFTEWNGRMDKIPAFIGITNYLTVFKDSNFLNSFIVTSKFTFVNVILSNVLGFTLALLVTRKLKISNTLRTLFYTPNLIGGLVLGFIWGFIFTGVFQSIADVTGLQGFSGWLADYKTGFWGLVIISVWQGSGYLMVIYIAALKNVPRELLEAAEIDGANGWQRTKNIVLPLIAPAITICLFLTLAGSYKIYDSNLSLTAGGPRRKY